MPGNRGIIRRAALSAGLLAALLAPHAARAQVCTSCECEAAEDKITVQFIQDEGTVTRSHIDKEFNVTRGWLLDVFNQDLQPWLKSFATQMSAVSAQQTLAFGGFIDAQSQLSVQRLFQRLSAEAHRDYQPSMGVCTVGTTVRSLAAAQEFGEFNANALARAGLARGTGNIDSNATEGEQSDRAGRLVQLQDRFCDAADNNAGLVNLCSQKPHAAVDLNRDIDYAGVMERSPTLDIDFTRPQRTADETDAVALANNLYGHRAMFRPPETSFDQDKTRILDFRSVMAQRNVAAASFYTIAGLKSHGSPDAGADQIAPVPAGAGVGLSNSNDTALYIKPLLKALGVADADLPTLLGDRPGYDAQMEILTKKIYQDPTFYTALYETPANVQRQKVAMQAVGLMQDFDTLQSNLRTEMMLSQMLELEIAKLQNNVQNEIGLLAGAGPRGSKE